MTIEDIREDIKIRKKLIEELEEIKLIDRDLVDIVKFHKPEYNEILDLENMGEDKNYQLILYIQGLLKLAYRQKSSIQTEDDFVRYTMGQLDDCAYKYAIDLVNDYSFDAESVITKYNECVKLYNSKPRGEVLEEFLKLPNETKQNKTK